LHPAGGAGQLKVGREAAFYEPELNPTYNDLAVHYGAGILPAQPYHARDKAKVEAGVQFVQRWVLAALRKRQFFSLAELNEAIGELIGKLNRRPFLKLPGTRKELYRSIDLPALQPLPAQPYVFAEWKRPASRSTITWIWSGIPTAFRIHLSAKEVDVHYTGTTVEILYQGKRVASHARSHRPGKHTKVGTSAKSASEIPGVDALADCGMGDHPRTVHGPTGGQDHGRMAAPGTGLSLLHGIDRAEPALRQGAAGSRCPACHPPPRAQLPKREIDWSGA